MSGRNSFPESHRLFAGFLAPSREKIVNSLNGHDLILVLGAPVFTVHVEGFGPFIPAGAQLLQLTDDPAAASWTPVGVSVFTGIKLGICALLEGPPPRPRPAPKPLARATPLSGARLTDKYLLQQIAALRPPGSIIVEEAPSSRGPMHDHLPIDDKDSFYTCASGGLGHGLPAAVGVALGRPGERVIAIVGDGSAMYAIQGLSAAAQLGLPMTFIIIKNGSYEALHEFAVHFGLGEALGGRLPPLDFCALARAQGMEAARVVDVAELDQSLQAAFRSKLAMLVEVHVEA
jgi:benzoylformate decarboxylase